jgi:hypothetical protein
MGLAAKMALRRKNMKTHIVVVEFAKKYGVKEGLILTELCRRAYSSGVNAIPFSVSQGKAFFPYMSEKQIRLALDNLKAAGSIDIAHSAPTVNRTISYSVQEAVGQFYANIITAHQFALPNSALPQSGGR